MSFKSGNIVRKIDTYWHGSLNESRNDIGKLYVIEYSYGEKYGDGTCYGGYSIMDMETGGSSSWWNEDCLKFVEEGSVELINQLKIKCNRVKEQQKDLSWIKENFSQSLSANSILTLFNKVGYKCAFKRNGEYYALMTDWLELYPIFNAIFRADKNQMMEFVDKTFKEDFKEKYKNSFSSFYEEVAAM